MPKGQRHNIQTIMKYNTCVSYLCVCDINKQGAELFTFRSQDMNFIRGEVRIYCLHLAYSAASYSQLIQEKLYLLNTLRILGAELKQL